MNADIPVLDVRVLLQLARWIAERSGQNQGDEPCNGVAERNAVAGTPPRTEQAPANLWSMLTADRRQRVTARLSDMIQRQLQLDSQGREIHAEDPIQLK